MTESLLDRSARYIDGAVYEGPRTVNPIDGSFHEVAEGVGLVCGFSHIWTVDADQGLVVLDTSLPGFASVALEHLRRWRDAPVDTIVYTHGHVDHVGGARIFLDDAAERKRPSPTVVAHDAVVRRFDRYDLARDYNEIVNGRQFGPNFRLGSFAGDWVKPEVTYTDGLDLEVGAASLRLIHEKGETDDHTIAWVPHQGVLFTGDLIIWSFPNAGNPQKAQRYPAEWAAALRRMIDLRPSLLVRCPQTFARVSFLWCFMLLVGVVGPSGGLSRLGFGRVRGVARRAGRGLGRWRCASAGRRAADGSTLCGWGAGSC